MFVRGPMTIKKAVFYPFVSPRRLQQDRVGNTSCVASERNLRIIGMAKSEMTTRSGDIDATKPETLDARTSASPTPGSMSDQYDGASEMGRGTTVD